MNAVAKKERPFPVLRVDVVEGGARARSRHKPCIIGRDVTFSTEPLESYFLTGWEPVTFDALLVAAAVEFCDKSQRRPVHNWARRFELRIPVHEPARWNAKNVRTALVDALELLTGDQWYIDFVARSAPLSLPRQIHFSLPQECNAVIPFSDGLDSRAVAGLMAQELGARLVRVRLGSKTFDAPARSKRGEKQPFTSIPYQVPLGRNAVESSARSRGFKFAVMSGIAAYLVKAERIIVPESGQGALGPALVAVGQSYEDYRNHPVFTEKMEKFLHALLGYRVRFDFPQLWQTKGETLARFINECGDKGAWATTWSCWQGNRQVSVKGRKRQCGICAACMLRRLSVHAAGLEEPGEFYVWENLRAAKFEAGAARGFKKITDAQRQYAIAATLHLDHLATLLRSPSNQSAVNLAVAQLSASLGLKSEDVCAKLIRMISKHESEWRSFLESLGPNSFVARWTVQS